MCFPFLATTQQWSERRIGFHLSDVNPVIEKYAQHFLSPPSDPTSTAEETCANSRVFVPLCGKTVDMVYLATTAHASEVVGVEGIRLALEEFAEENPSLNIKTDSTMADGFERFEGDRILLLKGDYFNLDSTKTRGTFGLIYDRGSLVAIDPSLRPAYVDVQGSLLAPGGRILLVALERKGSVEAMKLGPPFSLSESSIRTLYEGKDWVQSIKVLQQSDQLEEKPEDKERYPDLDQLLETVYSIQSKGA
jgi:thiopurine S-methyltransferase